MTTGINYLEAMEGIFNERFGQPSWRPEPVKWEFDATEASRFLDGKALEIRSLNRDSEPICFISAQLTEYQYVNLMKADSSTSRKVIDVSYRSDTVGGIELDAAGARALAKWLLKAADALEADITARGAGTDTLTCEVIA